jgi:hypothetical protein
MVSTLGTGGHRGSADLARLDVNRSLLHERRVLLDPAARAIRTLDGVISASGDSLPPTDVHLSQHRPAAFTMFKAGREGGAGKGSSDRQLHAARALTSEPRNPQLETSHG